MTLFPELSRKLNLLVACAIFPALLIILFSGLSQREQAIEQTNQVLENFTNGVADLQLEKTSQIKLFLQTLAALPEVKNLDAAGCTRLFEKFLKDNPGFANITLTDMKGVVLASGLPSKAGGVNVSDRTGFKEAVRTKAFSAGDYIVGRFVKQPVLPFGLPVLGNDGSPVGVLLCSHLLEKYTDYFTNVKLMPDSRLVLLDRNGIRLLGVVRQGEKPPVGTPVVSPNWRIISDSASDTGHFTGLRYDGVEVLFYFRKLRLNPSEPPYIIVFTNTPLSAILAAPNRSLWLNLGFLTLAGLLALAIARVLGRALVASRFEALQKSEEELSRQKDLLHSVIEGTSDAVFVKDSLGRYLLANSEVARVVGKPLDEIIGKDDTALFNAADALEIMNTDRLAMESVLPLHVEETVCTTRGVLTYHSTKGPVHDKKGATIGMFGISRDITALKRAEKALQESEERYRSILQTAMDGFWLADTTGRLLQVNASYCRMCGYSEEELLSMRISDLDVDEDDQNIVTHFQKIIAQGDDLFETRHRRKDGSIFNLEVCIQYRSIAGGQCVCFLRDITARKKAEADLLKLRSCVEKCSTTIVITDASGVIEYVNPAFTQTSGYAYADAIGGNPRMLKSGVHDEKFYKSMLQRLMAGETWRGEICNRNKRGQLYWENVSISPILDKDGSVRNFVAVKEDISDKKDLERIKEDVDRIMRHDLKTPLNAIIGMPQILEMDGNLTPEQLELVKVIEHAGRRMLFMIDSSLDLFKMETGSYEYTPTAVNALTVIEQIARDSRAKMTAKNLSLRVMVDGHKPEPGQLFAIASEERLLYSLLSNLISNAIEASPNDEEIIVEFTNNQYDTIVVRNKGVVPKEIRNTFFGKYKTFGKMSGTGLGTYSAGMLASVMGYGIFMCTSDEGGDTCIALVIPHLGQG
jgi:PAS domain S-box-containing protein